MKSFFLAAIAALFLVSFSFSAFAQTASLPSSATATIGTVERIVNARVAQTDAALIAARADVDRKAAAGQLLIVADFARVRAAAAAEANARADRDRVLGSDIAKLARTGKATRAQLTALIADVKKIDGLAKGDHEQLGVLAGQLTAVVVEQTRHVERMNGIEVRQGVTDRNVTIVNSKVDALAASLWQSSFDIGIYSGRGIGTSETGFSLDYGSLSPSGNGWIAGLSVGAGDLFSSPHPTSFLAHAGAQVTMGSVRSPILFNAGLFGGAASKSSLSRMADTGFAVGGEIALVVKPAALSGLGFKLMTQQVFGRYEGFGFYGALTFDPSKLPAF